MSTRIADSFPGTRRLPVPSIARRIFLGAANLVLVLVCSCTCSGCSAGGGSANGGANGTLSITPRTGSVFLGEFGGPFDPLSYSYTLMNSSGASIDWTVSASETWVVLGGATAGSLPPQGSTSVTISLDAASAGNLALGLYTALVQFRVPVEPAFQADRTVILDVFEFSDGWTTFTPSLDTKIIYVSQATGDDSFDGLSESRPKRSIAAGVELMRHGFPDWLLLKRGDSWNESLQQWKKSGRSLNERILVSTYGSSIHRPLLRTGQNTGIVTFGGGGSPPTIDHVAIVGLHFLADGFTGIGDQVGAEILQPGSNLLIEDCKFERYSSNLVIQGTGGRHSNFQLRRSVIVDAYSVHGTGNHSSGLYTEGVDGLLIEENVFDHNGWNETVPDAGADIFSHNVYINNDNSGLSVRGNLFVNGSSHGLQLRCGGEVLDNLFVRNSIALLVGGGDTPDPAGVTAEVRGNVILDGKDIEPSQPRGWGLILSNIASGNVASNLIANNTGGNQPVAIKLAGTNAGDVGDGIGVHDLIVHDNIVHNWGGSVVFQGDASGLSDLRLERCDIQEFLGTQVLLDHEASSGLGAIQSTENRFYSLAAPLDAWVKIAGTEISLATWQQQVGDSTSTDLPGNYTEPSRSLGTYSLLLGGAGTHEDFMRAARGQSRSTWRPELTAAAANTYLRAGFDLSFH